MTIAQQIKWDFTNGDLEIRDNNRNLIYLEDSDGIWSKWEYDSQGIIYHEGSNKNWAKYEFDSQGNEIYYEDSRGEIRDNRPKMSEVDELKHRLAMVKGDLDAIRTFIHMNGLDEKFQRPTKTSDDAWTLLNNIEIACDLSDTESLNWRG